MHRLSAIMAVIALAPLQSGCVAAVIPALAAGALTKSRVDGDGAAEARAAKVPAEPKVGFRSLAYSQSDASPSKGEATQGDPVAVSQPDTSLITPSTEPSRGAFGALDETPYGELLAFAEQQAATRAEGREVTSSILVPNVDLDNPETVACDDKPLGVMFDLDDEDGTPLAKGVGFQPQPGLKSMLERLRAQDIRIVWISGQSEEFAPRLRASMDMMGFSSVSDRDLFLFDRGAEDRKELRRQEVADKNCIVAIAGDDYADFDELYDYVLYPEVAAPLDDKFGAGWFLTPPPFSAIELKTVASPAQQKGSQ